MRKLKSWLARKNKTLRMHRHLALCIYVLLAACEASTIATVPADLGKPVTREYMIESASDIGPVEVRKVTAAHWEVPLGGLLNLDHPKVVEAGFSDRPEPIDVFVYTLDHPEYGVFIIDSGASELFARPEGNPLFSMPVSLIMNIDKFKLVTSTRDIAAQTGPISGVFLTHIHLDHIMGMSDLPQSTPVFIGPGDASSKVWHNAITRGTTDRLLGNQGVLREWDFSESRILDLFGDGSVFAIHSPGHTPGATAYLVASTDGAQLMIGDATHTRWGWENGVEAGSFSADIPTSAESLLWLKSLAADLPTVKVHPGHQHLY